MQKRNFGILVSQIKNSKAPSLATPIKNSKAPSLATPNKKFQSSLSHYPNEISMKSPTEKFGIESFARCFSLAQLFDSASIRHFKICLQIASFTAAFLECLASKVYLVPSNSTVQPCKLRSTKNSNFGEGSLFLAA